MSEEKIPEQQEFTALEPKLPGHDLHIGKNIVKLRQHLKLSQQDFALKLGVSKATVSLWENERKYPTRKNLEKLASVFKVDPQELFGRDFASHLALQPQFCFKPAIYTVKEGVELHIEGEKLSHEELHLVEKAIRILKVFFS